ncbi:uncharacterized protein LOC101863352 [Aplysia californica]|uniref:Uncharacterized protein LOC101863352 n=1 Tax=Aplysia californica TaxID=6500 RepID=A0ABM0JTF4_APLCA|nr:uncharacterized protein LOC101863352 [Aplysia californica]
MTLRCSLNDTAMTVNAGLVGRRDVTQTLNNVQHVTSLVVTRNNGEQVASVTQFDPAKALVDLASLQVTGDVSGTSGEKGYIELTWLYPSAAQAGEYVCEVNAIGDVGHNIVFSTTLEIGVTTPTIDDLVNHIKDLENDTSSTRTKIDQIKNDISAVHSQLANCSKATHTETGILHCGDSTHWVKSGQWDRNNFISHKFQYPYDQPPIVKLGIVSLDHDNNANTRFDVELTKVDENGFQVECQTWADSRLFDISVSWISMSK